MLDSTSAPICEYGADPVVNNYLKFLVSNGVSLIIRLYYHPIFQ
jgi:hypothetical protein